MKLRILVDNYTFIDQYYVGEPGLSYYLEEDGKTWLFDAGYSDIFLKNAFSMNLPMHALDGVVISHGHNDHTRGLLYLHEWYEKLGRYGVPLLAHPAAFAPKRVGTLDIGSPMTAEALSGVFALRLEKKPLWLSPKLAYLGEIEKTNSFEGHRPIGKTKVGGQWESDFVCDDTALAYRSEEGLVVIAGCSHAGICNIIEQAKRVCRDERIAAVVGGFHLMNPEPDVLEQTVAYFKALQPGVVYAAHCCDFPSKRALADVVPVKEAGVNLELEWV